MKYDYAIVDQKYSRALMVIEGGPVYMNYLNEIVYIHSSDVDRVVMMEPKLLKKGCIMFYDENGKTIELVTLKGNKTPAFIEVSNKDKKDFYLIFAALRDMGFKLVVI